VLQGCGKPRSCRWALENNCRTRTSCGAGWHRPLLRSPGQRLRRLTPAPEGREARPGGQALGAGGQVLGPPEPRCGQDGERSLPWQQGSV